MSKTGYVDNDAITEASGLCRSISNPGLLYSHNDSGGLQRSNCVIGLQTLESVCGNQY